jgi:hypothetical protein
VLLISIWQRPQPPIPALKSVPEVAVQKTSPPVQVSFANHSKLLVIPEDTGTPDVTFVWVLPNQRQVRGSTN